MKKRILLTGSEGKICSLVIKPILGKSATIIPFDLVLGDDILDEKSIKKKIAGVDVVIHTAAVPGPKLENESAYKKINYKGTVNLIKCAKAANVKQFIFFSSFSRYGTDSWMRNRNERGAVEGMDVASPIYLPIDEDHPSILDHPNYDNLYKWAGLYYGKSKALIEKYAEETVDDSFQFISLRLSGFKQQYSRKSLGVCEKIFNDVGNHNINARKMSIYGMSGITTPSILISTIQACIAFPPKERFMAFNTVESNEGLDDIIGAYFPNLVSGSIFSNERVLSFLKSRGVNYTPSTRKIKRNSIMRTIDYLSKYVEPILNKAKCKSVFDKLILKADQVLNR
jgi:hypothetical protein